MASDVAADAERKPDAPGPKAVGEKPEGAGAAGTAPSAAESTKPGQAAPAGGGTSIGERQVQAKSAGAVVGAADDPAERAADRAADKVVRMPEPAAAADKKPEGAAPPATPAPGAQAAGAAPQPAGPSPASTAGGAGGQPAPGAQPGAAPKPETVQRKEDAPAEQQRMPAPTPATPASPSGPGTAAGPDSTTPAGPTPGATQGPGGQGPDAAKDPGAPGAAGQGGTTTSAGPQVTTPGGSAPVAAGATGEAGAEAGPGGKAGAETGQPAPEPEPPAPEGEQPARETPQVPKEVQEYLDASRGKGAPLPEKVRKSFEGKYQRPFDDVRIHDGGAADDAARKIDALAFTRGNDIYFRTGAYDPEGPEGKKLIAHELAHVVQQRPGVNRKNAPGLGGNLIRRTTASSESQTALTLPGDLDPAEQAAYKGPPGRIDTSVPSLSLNDAYVPSFKVGLQGTLTWNRATRGDTYRATWAAEAATALRTPIVEKAKDLNQTSEPYYFQRTGDILVFGTAADIGNALSTIPWDKKNFKKHDYQIDHKHEFQLGGPENQISNLWLLDRSTNAGSGGAIMKSVEADVEAFVRGAAPKLTSPPSAADVKGRYALTFKKATAGPNPRQRSAAAVWTKTLSEADSWSLTELANLSAVTPLKEMTPKNREKVEGTASQLSISTRRGGGRGGTQSVPYNATSGEIDTSKLFLRGAYKVVSGRYTGGDIPPPPGQNVGSMLVNFFAGNGELTEAERTFPIMSASGVKYGGLLDTGAIRDLGKQLKHKKASPVELAAVEFDFETGLVGRGTIPTPSIKLLQNVQLGVVIEGKDVGLEATISGGELKLPGPFKVSGGSLTLAATSGGFSVDGRIDFEIERLAKGYVQAAASSRGQASGFELDGKLEFDTKMFTKADLGLSYKDGKWGVSGELAVGPDKIKGIKSASAKVEVKDETVTASGEFETSIKGVDKGTVGFKYKEAAGMEITGEILLGKGIPGIRSGKLDATVKEGAEGWSLSGAVSVEPSVPGLSGTIGGKYEDGAFLVEADLGYERGLAKGTVKIGVTNQPVGADGKPAGAPKPDGALTAYGGGSVTLRITPWLQGTIGLQLKPNGEIEVSGEVALPSAVEVFPEKKVDKQLVSIGIDIPIVGVAVAGQRIGIFATIRGGLDATAGFGPGQLKDVALRVTYNPDHPEGTTVTGTGTFLVPAQAGLRLHVDGGLGAGIPVVSATAGVTIFGEIGVVGQASAGAKVDWTPSTGIVLDAKGEISVQPKFKFGIDAFVDVSADLFVTTIELYHQKWSLASFEYGSNLEFGLTFPIHYESEKPFELSFDQMQLKYPHIEPGELLGGLMKQLVG